MVGMEACAGAHYWARELIALGHKVVLLPPQYVKPYVKRNKNDTADAEAIESETQASQADHPSTGIPAGFALPAQVKKLEQRFDPPCSRLRAERERARPGIPLLVPGRATENPNRKRGRYE